LKIPELLAQRKFVRATPKAPKTVIQL